MLFKEKGNIIAVKHVGRSNMTCDMPKKEVHLMHKTSVILLRNDLKELYVNKYIARKTNEGQLVLDLIERMGRIYELKHMNTEEAFLATMRKSYHEKKRKVKVKIGEAFEEVRQAENVVVTLHDKDMETYRPYQIMLFYNNVVLEKLKPGETPEPMEEELLVEVRGRRKNLFVFKKTKSSGIPDMERIFTERIPIYAEVKSVDWLDENTHYKLGDVDIFTKEWAEMMIAKLDDLDEDAVVYPALNGEWVPKQKDFSKKMLPRELYCEKLRGTRANKDFWEWYLENFKEVEVEYSENSPEGKVIRH